MTAAQVKSEKEEAREYLRGILKPGDTVYCILRNVSRSGMSRVIDLVTLAGKSATNNHIRGIGHVAAQALGQTYDPKREGIKIGGCGMDMGFELVYNLGRVLFPEGFKVEGRGRNGDTTGWDNDGGYALTHRWI